MIGKIVKVFKRLNHWHHFEFTFCNMTCMPLGTESVIIFIKLVKDIYKISLWTSIAKVFGKFMQ